MSLFYNAQNANIRIGNSDCDYISFGRGKEILIMLPGVGDGFKTAKGVAVPFALMYRKFARHFKVYVFSRRNDMPEGFTTADMADDIADIMEKLRLEKAAVFGVSQGGMIAQQMAVRYPDKVKKLVLAVTAAGPNPIMRDSLGSWLSMAESDDYRGIMMDTAERSYTGAYLRRGKRINKVLAVFKPKDYSRFSILCRSCLSHDVTGGLCDISCPTLIIGAGRDKVLGGEASEELHRNIPGSTLYMYKDFSHGVYEQASDFNDRVIGFLLNE